MRLSPQVENIMKCAVALGQLQDRFLFVGGAVVDLLLSDPEAPPARPTNDVDLVVELASTIDYYTLAEAMRELGFREDDQDHIICRWRWKELIIDVMPSSAEVLGFSNSWYGPALENSNRVTLPNERVISVIDPVHFIATKMEAFSSRGASDLFASHDFEDIVAIFNGRSEIADEIAEAPILVRNYLANSLHLLLKRREIDEALEGHLASLQDSAGRKDTVIARISEVARLAGN